mgnify:CR=1 FL=1
METDIFYKEYIIDNISKINEHSLIIDLIKKYNCNYTENNNGIYLDLNNLTTNILQEIYEIINKLNSVIHYDNHNEIIMCNIKKEINKKTEKKMKNIKGKEYKYIFMSEFSDHEKEIIKFSKQI